MGKNTVKNRSSFYQKKFLENLIKSAGRVEEAALATGISRRTVYKWLERSEEFKEKYEDTRITVCERVERALDTRGVDGWDEPVYYQGEVCGYVRKFSDTLLLARAKALMPEKYRERHEITGEGGGPVKIESPVFQVVNEDSKELLIGLRNGKREAGLETDKDIRPEQSGISPGKT